MEHLLQNRCIQVRELRKPGLCRHIHHMLNDRENSKTQDAAGHAVQESSQHHHEILGIKMSCSKDKCKKQEHIDDSQVDTRLDKLDSLCVVADNQGSG